MDATEYIVENLRHPDAENQRRTLAGIAGRTCEGCGACCGRILPMTIRERARLLDYARRHGVEPHADASNMCSMLDPETRRCRAYPARPHVCRAWERPDAAELVGTRPGQPCGMRADMARAFWAHAEEYRNTDTWELFGLGDGA